jgi:hypothetical protein
MRRGSPGACRRAETAERRAAFRGLPFLVCCSSALTVGFLPTIMIPMLPPVALDELGRVKISPVAGPNDGTLAAPTAKERQLCREVVDTVLTTKDPIEFERAKFLVEQLRGCRIRP